MNEIKAGSLLISDPFLQDPNFMRTVILLCEHQHESSFGFVINRAYEQNVGTLVEEMNGCDFPVFYGGPVQPNTLHFIHTVPELIPDSIEVAKGIYWGGELKSILLNIQQDKIKEHQIRFYVGYSGWGEGQLAGEVESKSWIIKPATIDLVFHNSPDQIWKASLKGMGGEYEQMVNYPIDPQLN